MHGGRDKREQNALLVCGGCDARCFGRFRAACIEFLGCFGGAWGGLFLNALKRYWREFYLQLSGDVRLMHRYYSVLYELLLSLILFCRSSQKTLAS